MLHLHYDLILIARRQADLARSVKVSAATINLLIKHNKWPTSAAMAAQLRERIPQYLVENGLPHEWAATTFDMAPPEGRGADRLELVPRTSRYPWRSHNYQPMPSSDTEGIDADRDFLTREDLHMLLRHHTLSADARRHFNVASDPFVNEMRENTDVFETDDIRYVRSAMRHTAKHGGMLAVVAESGGGKSTLRQDLIDWINVAGEPITVIEPYVLGMEENERRGKALKAADLTGAVIRAVAPGATLRMSLQDRADQMHRVLKGSAQVGRKHVLIIEEAHALAVPTLKHLKRFYELQDGFKKLLSIILVGQTELEHKLSEHNPEVREVVQRCELVKLPPLDNHVEAYLRHKMKRANLAFESVFEPDAVDAIRAMLRQTVTESRRGQRVAREQSLCYPLAINNLVTRAMNEAVKIGATKVGGALIAAAVRGA